MSRSSGWVAALRVAIDVNAEKREPALHLGAHLARVLPHPAGEDEHVEASDRRHHRRDLGSEVMD